MNEPQTYSPHFISEVCADLVDVLTDSVDEESLHAVISIFLEVSGATSGAAFTVNGFGEIEEGISLTAAEGVINRSNYATTSYVAQRSIQTLHTEFTVTSNSSQMHYEYAFPLRVRGRALGAIVIQSNHSNLLREETISLLQNIADIAASTIEHTHQVLQNRTLATQLQSALNSRVILEQAKGVLAERSNTDCVTAFGELRQMARREQRPIHHVASDIVATVGTDNRNLTSPLRSSVA